MDQLERRIIHLEATARSERERTDYHLAGLRRRVEPLEARPVIGAGAWVKVILAICLPLLVAGDWHAAVKAARLAGGQTT